MRDFFFAMMLGIFACLVVLAASLGYAQESMSPVEINGDHVEYMMEEDKIVARGNVVIIRDDTKLTCDSIEFLRTTQVGIAQGNVVLHSPQGSVRGEKMTFNFETMTGELSGGYVTADPFYGEGALISKVGDNHMRVDQGYITTCDLRKPHFRIASEKIDIHPGETARARHIRLYLGNLPLMYLPQYTKDLRDQHQRVVLTPGYDKEWGAFLLQAWRYYFSENFKGTIHLDYRERKDFAWGIDLDYNTVQFGKGIIRTYYMNERNITSDHPWEPKPSPTIERERFKAEWQHQWRVNDRTNAIWQYYKLSDNTILKDYFKREYERDPNPKTFFLLTQALPAGTLSFRTDARVNRFFDAVERLPEIQYLLTNQKIGNTGFYLKSRNMFSNLVSKTASPSEIRANTMRVHSDSEISYPIKVGFLEFKPYVGERLTYYSKTIEPSEYGSVRTQFLTGAALSTKFYKTYDAAVNRWGMEIDRLRHIVTPSLHYRFAADPSIAASRLDQFDDGIDGLAKRHSITFSLENKLQTKRGERTVELLRAIVEAPFYLKEEAGKSGGFAYVSTGFDFRPTDWLTFYADTKYDKQRDRLESANFDLFIKDARDKRWSVGIGKRYQVDVDDQITTEAKYAINPKWEFRTYARFDIDNGELKEHEYALVRDLHCWQMEMTLNETRGEGSKIWIIFRLKAFPKMGFDFGTSFNRRRAGSND